MRNSLLKLLRVPWRLTRRPVQLTLAVLFLLSPMWAYAQISGTIVDENSQPLAGVTVVIKGTTTGTITDIDGNYSVEAASDNVIVITYVGYQPQEITVGAQSVIDMQLALDTQQLEELIVTGYSVERKKDLLGAVAVMDLDQIKDVTVYNTAQALQGRMPGVFVDQVGDPGQGASVRIRGNSTLGNNDPLYIVDGVPVQPYITNENGTNQTNWGISWLNPGDVESIQVLKDASSASIYGSRASNGVIIITTKQPKDAKASITVNARYGVQTWTDPDEMANNRERAIIAWQQSVNDGADPDNDGIYTYQWHFDPSLGTGIQGNGVPVLDQIIYPDWLDQTDNMRPAGHAQSVHGGDIEVGTDWWDESSQTGIVQNYDVGFSQGTDRGGVQLSMNYFDQKGVLLRTGYERFGVRLNSNYNFIDNRLTVGQNFNIVKGEREWLDSQIGGDLAGIGYRLKSILPVRTEDGRFAGPPGAGFSDRDNHIGSSEDNRDDRIHNLKVFGNVYVDFEIIEGLNFRSTLGVDYDRINSTDIFRTYSRGFLSNSIAELTRRSTDQINWVFNNTLTYNKTINSHSFTVLAGTEAVENFVDLYTATAKDFALETKEYLVLDAASGERNTTGSTTGFSLFSYFGKANYSFQDKYLASFTIRRDGSSRFGTQNRFAVFPAASVGWRIGDEDFMSGLGWLSDLKIRVGWGKTGNQDILNDARFSLFRALYAEANILPNPWALPAANNSTSYDIGNQENGLLQSGFYAVQTGNDELKWEEQTEINIGLDFGFLDQRLIGSFEFYNKKTTDILIQPVPIAAIGDGKNRFANGADMETNGWEGQITYNSQRTGDWTYSVSLNLSHYSDQITALPEGLWASYPGNEEQNIIGQSADALFGYVADGLFQNQGEVDGHADQVGKRIGQLRYKDLNNDGVISSLDQEFLGTNARADLEYGIHGEVGWKDFDLRLFFWGAAGRDMDDTGNIRRFGTSGTGDGENIGQRALEAWNFTQTGSIIPALTRSTSNARVSSYTIRNASFFALRQATLGYTLPASVVSNTFLSNLRVYFTGEGLFWLTDGKGEDEWTAPGWHVDRVLIGADPKRARRFPFTHSATPRGPRYTLGLTVGF